MGISIDKAINGVEKRILPIYDNDADHQALITAIETMRKYQKIQEIVGNYGFDSSWLCLKKIREVMEDGNDD